MKRLTGLLAEALNIRAGEGRAIALMGAYAFLIGIFLAYFISLANAVFLGTFGVEYLPHGYIATGLVGYGAGALLSALERRLSVMRLMACALLLPLVLTGLYCVGFGRVPERWLAFAMFVTIGPFFTLLYFVFRSLVGRLFDLRQGKRLFGLISSGDVVSSIIGFFSVPLLLRFFDGDLAALLAIAAAALVLCLAVLYLLRRDFADRLSDVAKEGPKHRGEGFGALLGKRYFVWLFAVSTAAVFIFYYIDYAFLGQLRLRFDDKAMLAQFISLFYGLIRIIELVFKTFVSGRLLGRYGLRLGLVGLPVLLLACGVLAVLASGLLAEPLTVLFLLMALAKLIERVMAKSLYDPSFNVLYQPLEPHLRLSLQTRVEGIVQQVAVGLAGLSLLLFNRYGSFALVLYALTLLAAAWVYATVRMYREYRTTLLQNLEDRAPVGDSYISGAELLEQRVLDGDPVIAERALGLLGHLAPAKAVALGRRLLQSPSPDARLVGLEVALRRRDLGLRPVIERLADAPPPVGPRVRVGLATWGDGPPPQGPPAYLLSAPSGDLPALQAAAELLEDERYGHAAAETLAANEAALPLIEAFLARPGLTPRTVDRALRAVGRIGGPRAQALLSERLVYPDREVRQRALEGLRKSGYRAAPEDVARLRQAVEEAVSLAVWNMAALVDLEGEDQRRLRQALGAELDSHRERVFLLLSLIYEPRYIQLVRDSFVAGSSDGKVYALELIDVFVSQDLKVLLFPLVEDLPLGMRLRRLEEFFPQQRLGVDGRLKDIANCEYMRTGRWTRACALWQLGARGRVCDELAAHLFNADPFLSQTAAWGIYRNDPTTLEGLSVRLSLKARRRLGRDMAASRVGTFPHLVIERVARLKETRLFATVPEHLLVDAAAALRPVTLAAGQKLPEGDELFLVLAGTVDLGDGRTVEPGHWLETVPPETRTTGACRLFALERRVVGDLAVDAAAAAGLLSGAEADNRRLAAEDTQSLAAL